MRWADLTALITAALWLGANLAIALVPMVMFAEAKIIGEGPAGVLLLRQQLGEMFGQVLQHYMQASCVLAVLFFIARMWGWTIRLRRRQFRRTSMIGAAIMVGILVAFACAWTSVVQVEDLRVLSEIAQDKDAPDAKAVRQRFEAAHKQSMHVFVVLTALLAASVTVLAASLARRGALPASAPARAP